ncbi:unnamed protein product [Closterium sp. NIES-64]|nr:unnamed protein product [Closterium sp. NIES-64]
MSRAANVFPLVLLVLLLTAHLPSAFAGSCPAFVGEKAACGATTCGRYVFKGAFANSRSDVAQYRVRSARDAETASLRAPTHSSAQPPSAFFPFPACTRSPTVFTLPPTISPLSAPFTAEAAPPARPYQQLRPTSFCLVSDARLHTSPHHVQTDTPHRLPPSLPVPPSTAEAVPSARPYQQLRPTSFCLVSDARLQISMSLPLSPPPTSSTAEAVPSARPYQQLRPTSFCLVSDARLHVLSSPYESPSFTPPSLSFTAEVAPSARPYQQLRPTSFCLVSDSRLHINMRLTGYLDNNRSDIMAALVAGAKVRTWIRELGFIWWTNQAGGSAAQHSLRLVARRGPKQERGEGFMGRIEVDGIAVPRLGLGDELSLFDGEGTVTYARQERSGNYDVDVYSVKLAGLLEAEVRLRPAHPLLQEEEDAEVHLMLDLGSIRHTPRVHGVVGQAYRDEGAHCVVGRAFRDEGRVWGQGGKEGEQESRVGVKGECGIKGKEVAGWGGGGIMGQDEGRVRWKSERGECGAREGREGVK